MALATRDGDDHPPIAPFVRAPAALADGALVVRSSLLACSRFSFAFLLASAVLIVKQAGSPPRPDQRAGLAGGSFFPVRSCRPRCAE